MQWFYVILVCEISVWLNFIFKNFENFVKFLNFTADVHVKSLLLELLRF